MRRKVITTVVTFSTTTAAMKMEKTARESEFQGRLIPIPSEISAQCGLAWKCVEQSEEETEDFLKKKELAWDGIYRVLVYSGYCLLYVTKQKFLKIFAFLLLNNW